MLATRSSPEPERAISQQPDAGIQRPVSNVGAGAAALAVAISRQGVRERDRGQVQPGNPGCGRLRQAPKACGPAGIAVFKSFNAASLIAPFTLNEETFRVATTSLARTVYSNIKLSLLVVLSVAVLAGVVLRVKVGEAPVKLTFSEN